MPQELIKIQRQEPIAIVTLNRPEKFNALSPEMLRSIAEALESLDADQAFRVIVLHGGERAFAAGADIDAMAKASPVEIHLRNTRSYWQRIWAIDKPVIAAVSGVAFGGGCELAMGCDLIVASESARFGQPEVKLGIMPGAGGTQRLARAIGPYRAMEMILTGEPISAKEAYAAGLLNRVVPDDKVLEEAIALATVISERPAVAVRLARKALRHGFERTMIDGMEIERRNYRLTFDTEDQNEGMQAFLEKRPPKFKGR